MNILLFTLLAFLAEILGTIGGFGSSLLFVPLAGFFFDLHVVLGLTAIFHIFSNLSKLTMFRKGIDKKLVISIGIPAVLFVIVGARLSSFVQAQTLEMLLGIFLCSVSALLFFKSAVRLKPSVGNAIGGGSLSGFMAGLLGTGGAIRGLTLAAFDLQKQVFIATSAAIDLGIDFSRGIVYYSNGFMRMEDLYLIPILVLVSAGGTYAGKKLLQRFSQQQFKSIVLVLIMCVGVFSCWKAARELSVF